MAKIGRNDLCPCGSGIKYKKCCAQKSDAQRIAESAQKNRERTLTSAVRRIQQDAEKRQAVSFEFGVFFFFVAANGDAWALEMTDGDAIQIAENGRALDAPIVENEETIEINWSHTFLIKEKRSLLLTAYEDGKESCLEDAPVKEIYRAMRRIKKRLSQRDLKKLHIS